MLNYSYNEIIKLHPYKFQHFPPWYSRHDQWQWFNAEVQNLGSWDRIWFVKILCLWTSLLGTTSRDVLLPALHHSCKENIVLIKSKDVLDWLHWLWTKPCKFALILLKICIIYNWLNSQACFSDRFTRVTSYQSSESLKPAQCLNESNLWPTWV